jgi:hypothetical protein
MVHEKKGYDLSKVTDYFTAVGQLCETMIIHTNIIDSEPVVSKKYAVLKFIVT